MFRGSSREPGADGASSGLLSVMEERRVCQPREAVAMLAIASLNVSLGRITAVALSRSTK